MIEFMPGPTTVTAVQAQDPVDEVQQTQRDLQKTYEEATKSISGMANAVAGSTSSGANGAAPINGANPINGAAGDTGQTAYQGVQPGSLQSGLQGGLPGGPDLAAIQNFLGQPSVKRYVQVIQNPEFLQDVTAFATHPKRAQLGYVELGWIVAILMLKSYRMAKTSNWLKHLWISLSNLCLFWIGSLAAIPYFVIGPVFTKMVLDAIRIYRAG
jgi:hypothetical protein